MQKGDEPSAGSELFLRESTEEDLETIVRLEQDPDAAPFILPGSLDQHRVDWARSDFRYFTVCEAEGGGMVGFLILIPEAKSVGLRRMVIGPKGQGYGRRALALMEEMARKGEFTSVWLDVFADNFHARRLYEGAGYRRIGEVDFFGRPLLIYEKNLAGDQG